MRLYAAEFKGFEHFALCLVTEPQRGGAHRWGTETNCSNGFICDELVALRLSRLLVM